MKVRDFMKKEVITVDIKTPIMAALETMKHNKIKRLPVTKNSKFTGLVTRAMIRDASPSAATSLSVYELNYLISKMTVGDIMVKDPVTISPELPVEEAISLLEPNRNTSSLYIDPAFDTKQTGTWTGDENSRASYLAGAWCVRFDGGYGGGNACWVYDNASNYVRLVRSMNTIQ
jgi:CBS domain-containing protein